MAESFDAFQYVDHLRARWRTIALACGVAAALALGVSLLMPARYTATARVVIDAPAGTDLRSAMVVSPVYLESLKTYEHFAASDSLFLKALEKFQLRENGKAVESLKRGMLKVEIPRNTKILEISATLTDPKKAQALAQFIAEATVTLNQRLADAGDRELTASAEQRLEAARKRWEEAESAWSRHATAEPVGGLLAEIQSLESRRRTAEEELREAEKTLAVGSDSRSARASLEHLRGEVASLAEKLDRQRTILAKKDAQGDKLWADRKYGQEAYEEAERALRDVQASSGHRVERLRIVDPGIVPERPSSPKVPLNVFAALLLALVASVVYLTLQFSYRRQKRNAEPAALRMAGRGGDD